LGYLSPANSSGCMWMYIDMVDRSYPSFRAIWFMDLPDLKPSLAASIAAMSSTSGACGIWTWRGGSSTSGSSGRLAIPRNDLVEIGRVIMRDDLVNKSKRWLSRRLMLSINTHSWVRIQGIRYCGPYMLPRVFLSMLPPLKSMTSMSGNVPSSSSNSSGVDA